MIVLQLRPSLRLKSWNHIPLGIYTVSNKITSVSAVRQQQKQAMHNQSNYPAETEVSIITSVEGYSHRSNNLGNYWEPNLIS